MKQTKLILVGFLEKDSKQSLSWLRMMVMGFLVMTAIAAIYSCCELRRYLVERLQKLEASRHLFRRSSV